MRNGLQRSLKAGPSGKRNPFLLKSANVSPMCLCFSCKYLVSATSLVITLFSSRFVDPLTSLISLRVAQRNRMEFKPKLFASGVPTSWCPNVSGSRCLGVSVFRVVSRCTGVSGVLQRVFKLFSRYLHTGYYGSELFLYSLYEYGFATVFAMCLYCEQCIYLLSKPLLGIGECFLSVQY